MAKRFSCSYPAQWRESSLPFAPSLLRIFLVSSLMLYLLCKLWTYILITAPGIKVWERKAKFDYLDFIRLEILLLPLSSKYRMLKQIKGEEAFASLNNLHTKNARPSTTEKEKNPIYSRTGYKDLWCLMKKKRVRWIKIYFLLSTNNTEPHTKRGKKWTFSHFMAKMFINTNWGFA